MRILLIGSGGREHAMAWALAKSTAVSTVYAAPGNVGMAAEDKVECVDIAVTDQAGLLAFAEQHDIDLTVVGPEAPLVAGVVDRFRAADRTILGPSAAAARLEGSKAFAKDFMQRNGIPTAAYRRVDNLDDARAYLATQQIPVVIKADGLAAGKGVVVAQSRDEADAALVAMLEDGAFADAGSTVVIEEFMQGEEASFISLVDGRHCLPFASSQDHKARDEGDLGPNTGGMGAYSPAPVVSDSVHRHIIDDIVQPTIDALADEGMPFCGFLYVGLMIDDAGNARVVEYNVRLGDPETQPLLMRLDSDFASLCLAAAQGHLCDCEADWRDDASIGIVLAAGNYPAGSSRGEPISGVADAESLGCKVFHAGTASENGQLVTAGGRVLCVCARGDNIASAKALADKGAAAIEWTDRHYRRDIGHRAIARLD